MASSTLERTENRKRHGKSDTKVPSIDFSPNAIQKRIGLDLDRVAVETGVVQRWRKIENGVCLLLANLAAAIESMRVGAAAITTHTGWRITDQAIHKCVLRSAPFLRVVLAALLQQSAKLVVPRLGRAIRYVDASHVSLQGSLSRTVYRLHAVYSGDAERLVDIEITRDGSEGAERLQRAPHPVDSLVVGDRGLARANDIRALRGSGAHALVRASLHNLRLARRRRDDDGSEDPGTPVRWTQDEILQTIADRELAIGEDCEWPVHLLLGTGRKTTTIPARLIVIRLSPTAHETELLRVESNARRQGRELQPSTRKTAGYLVLLTTLPDGEFDGQTLGQVYRVRWQIETYFKHLKSDFDIDEVRARREDSVQSFLLSMLIVSVLTDRVATEEIFPPR